MANMCHSTYPSCPAAPPCRGQQLNGIPRLPMTPQQQPAMTPQQIAERLQQMSQLTLNSMVMGMPRTRLLLRRRCDKLRRMPLPLQQDPRLAYLTSSLPRWLGTRV